VLALVKGDEAKLFSLLVTMVKTKIGVLLKGQDAATKTIINKAIDLGANALMGKKIDDQVGALINDVVDLAVTKILKAAKASAAQGTLVRALVASVEQFVDGKPTEGLQSIGNAVWAFASPHIKIPGIPAAVQTSVKASMKKGIDALLVGNGPAAKTALWSIALPIAHTLISKINLPKPADKYTTAVRALLDAAVDGLATGSFKKAEHALEALATPLITDLVNAGIKALKLTKDQESLVNALLSNNILMTAVLGGDIAKASPILIDTVLNSKLATAALSNIPLQGLRDQAKDFLKKVLQDVVNGIFGAPKSKEEQYLLEAVKSSKAVPAGVREVHSVLEIPSHTVGLAQGMAESHALQLLDAIRSMAGETPSAIHQSQLAQVGADKEDLIKLYGNLNVDISGNKYTILGATLGSSSKFKVTMLGVDIYPSFNKASLIKAIGSFAADIVNAANKNKGKPQQVGGSPIPQTVGICSTDTKAGGGPDFKEWTMTFFSLTMKFMAGPVPLSATIELMGQAGIAWKMGTLTAAQKVPKGLTCKSGMMAVGAPYAGASLKIYGGVDALIAKAGIGALIQLIRVSLPLTVEAMIGGSQNNNCLSMNVVTQAGGGRFFVFVETLLTGKAEFDLFQWAGAKWVWPKQKELPTVDGAKQPKKLNFFGKCMYDAKYAAALKQPHMDPPPNAYKTMCVCTMFSEPGYASPLYKENQAGKVTAPDPRFRNTQQADGGYYEVDNVYGKLKKFKSDSKLWGKTKSMQCLGNCDDVRLLSYDKVHKSCGLNSNLNWKGKGVKGTGKQGGYTIFDMKDFSGKPGLEGNVCGIYIKAKKTAGNPGPTLCEELLECSQCTNSRITASLKDGKGGCLWKSNDWYDKKRDKAFKCGSANWLKGEGKSKAGGSNNIREATTDCTLNPAKCKSVTVAGKWSSSTVSGKPVTEIEYAKLSDTDCVRLSNTAQSSLKNAQKACNGNGSCGGVVAAGGKFYLCRLEKVVTRKLVLQSSLTKEGLKKTAGKGSCLGASGKGLAFKECKAAQAACQDDVTLYGGLQFSDWVATFGKADFNSKGMTDGGAVLNKVASIRVPTGCKLVIYPQDKFKGTPITLSAGDYSRTPLAPTAEVEDLLEEDNNEASQDLLQSQWGPFDDRRRRAPVYRTSDCPNLRTSGPADVYARICGAYQKKYVAEQHQKAQQKAFAHVKVDKGLASMKSFASMRVVDDKVSYVPLSSSGTPTKRGALEPDEWGYDGSGFLVQAQTNQKLSINKNLPNSGQQVGFSYRYNLPFCDGASDPAQCAAGNKQPLLYLKYRNGKKYRTCGGTTASSICKGCGAFCNSHDLCKGGGSGSCNRILSGSSPVFKQSFTFSNSYWCKCNSHSCIYKGQCRNKWEIEKHLCLSSNVGGAPGIVNCNSNADDQRWSMMNYRTTWQPRQAYTVYKKGPKPVKHQTLQQTSQCVVYGGPFKGSMQDRIFAEKAAYDTTGTANGLQSLISWNTEPPVYWTKDGSRS